MNLETISDERLHRRINQLQEVYRKSGEDLSVLYEVNRLRTENRMLNLKMDKAIKYLKEDHLQPSIKVDLLTILEADI